MYGFYLGRIADYGVSGPRKHRQITTWSAASSTLGKPKLKMRTPFRLLLLGLKKRNVRNKA